MTTNDKTIEDLFAEALEVLPDEWTIRIDLTGGNVRPYVMLLDEVGDALGDGPELHEVQVADRTEMVAEELTDCIVRLLDESGG